jgi:hypothetical protein
VKCVIDFFGLERVLFGTDAPMDTRGGSHFIPATISDVEDAVADESARAALFERNARRLLGSALPVASDQLGVTPASDGTSHVPKPRIGT